MGVPNHRALTWDGARAELQLRQLSGGYTSLWVNVDKVGRDFTIRMPDGKVFRADEIRLQAIRSYESPVPSEELVDGRIHVRIGFDSGDCSNSSGYSGGGYAFEFQDDHLASVAAQANASFPASCRPALGNAAGSAMYAMPLSEEQLVELFGQFRQKEDFWGGF